MPVSLGAQPLVGFDEPIGLLMDCHRRIESFLDVLIRVAERAVQLSMGAAGGGKLDAEHQEALRTALRYFRAAAPRHTEDEERSLFPLLRQSDDPRAQAALREIEHLEAEHKEADALHARADVLADRLLADGELPANEAQRLVQTLRPLRELYARHIHAEDTRVFPAARRALSAQQLQQVGREMAERRAADPGRAQSRCGQRRRRTLADPDRIP